MREEIENTLPKITLIISVFSLIFTTIEFAMVISILGIINGLAGVVLSICIYKKNYKKTSFVSIVCSSSATIISFIFLWMNL